MKFIKSRSSNVSKILKIVKMDYLGTQFSKEELADDFSVSLRTIQSDITEIRKEINAITDYIKKYDKYSFQ